MSTQSRPSKHWFNTTANAQCTRYLLFTTVLDIMKKVVSKNRILNVTVQAYKEEIVVPITSIIIESLGETKLVSLLG